MRPYPAQQQQEEGDETTAAAPLLRGDRPSTSNRATAPLAGDDEEEEEEEEESRGGWGWGRRRRLGDRDNAGKEGNGKGEEGSDDEGGRGKYDPFLLLPLLPSHPAAGGGGQAASGDSRSNGEQGEASLVLTWAQQEEGQDHPPLPSPASPASPACSGSGGSREGKRYCATTEHQQQWWRLSPATAMGVGKAATIKSNGKKMNRKEEGMKKEDKGNLILDASESNMDRLAQQVEKGEIVHTPSAQKSFPSKKVIEETYDDWSPLEVIKAHVEDLKAIDEKSEGKRMPNLKRILGKRLPNPDGWVAARHEVSLFLILTTPAQCTLHGFNNNHGHRRRNGSIGIPNQ
uniref:Uncharacterized protein n=1 Tax=Oryza glumipatula TaxID=40148 RepID=A0A0D9ZAW4_9ORYZ